MLTNIYRALADGIYLTVVGMGFVALALCLIIFSITLLNYLFPPEEAEDETTDAGDTSEPEPDRRQRAVPGYVLAAVALEHHRRSSGLGSELGSSQQVSPEFMSEGERPS